jgi:hypothetical protein
MPEYKNDTPVVATNNIVTDGEMSPEDLAEYKKATSKQKLHEAQSKAIEAEIKYNEAINTRAIPEILEAKQIKLEQQSEGLYQERKQLDVDRQRVNEKSQMVDEVISSLDKMKAEADNYSNSRKADADSYYKEKTDLADSTLSDTTITCKDMLDNTQKECEAILSKTELDNQTMLAECEKEAQDKKAEADSYYNDKVKQVNNLDAEIKKRQGYIVELNEKIKLEIPELYKQALELSKVSGDRVNYHYQISLRDSWHNMQTQAEDVVGKLERMINTVTDNNAIG